MATETAGTTTIFDVLMHTGTWATATNVSSRHEENNFKVVIEKAGIANGDTADHRLEFPICIPTKLATAEGDNDTVPLEFELMAKANRFGAWSDREKTVRDATVRIYDGSGLVFTMTGLDLGDLQWEQPFDARVVIRSRRVISGSRKGEEQVGSLSFTMHFHSWTDGL